MHEAGEVEGDGESFRQAMMRWMFAKDLLCVNELGNQDKSNLVTTACLNHDLLNIHCII